MIGVRSEPMTAANATPSGSPACSNGDGSATKMLWRGFGKQGVADCPFAADAKTGDEAIRVGRAGRDAARVLHRPNYYRT
jgi:hypothetical protein